MCRAAAGKHGMRQRLPSIDTACQKRQYGDIQIAFRQQDTSYVPCTGLCHAKELSRATGSYYSSVT